MPCIITEHELNNRLSLPNGQIRRDDPYWSILEYAFDWLWYNENDESPYVSERNLAWQLPAESLVV